MSEHFLLMWFQQTFHHRWYQLTNPVGYFYTRNYFLWLFLPTNWT
jgi:hypothetical protein